MKIEFKYKQNYQKNWYHYFYKLFKTFGSYKIKLIIK